MSSRQSRPRRRRSRLEAGRIEQIVERARRVAAGAAGPSASSRRAAGASGAVAWPRSRWKYCAGVRDVRDAHVVVGRELQEALEARRASARARCPRSRAAGTASAARSGPTWRGPAAMNWSMITWAPFAKSPNCASQMLEHVRRGDRVAVLEAEAGVLGERRVVDLERGLGSGSVLHRAVRLAGAHVVQHDVAVGERAALGVLAGQPDRHAVLQQRAEGERLGVAPVDAALVRAPCAGARAGSRASGAGVKPSGTVSSSSFSGVQLGLARLGPVAQLARLLLPAPRARAPRCRRARPRGPRRCGRATRLRIAATSSSRHDALADQLVARRASATGGCSAIRSYSCGCV